MMKNKRLTAGLLACAMMFGMGGIIPETGGFSTGGIDSKRIKSEKLQRMVLL